MKVDLTISADSTSFRQREKENLKEPEINLSAGICISSIAKNSVFLLSGHWVAITIKIIYSVVIARYLGPELYGIFNFGMSFYLAFFAITGLGMGMILSREVGSDKARSGKVVSQTCFLRLLAAVIAAVACSTAGWISEADPVMRKLLLIFSIALIGRAIVLWAEQVFTAHEANRYSFKLQTIFCPVEVSTGIILIFYGYGIITLAIIHAIFLWLQAILGIRIVIRNIVRFDFDYELLEVKSLLTKGLIIGIGVTMISWMQQGAVVIFHHVSTDINNLGQLCLNMQVFMILSIIPVAIGSSSLPFLSRTSRVQMNNDRIFVDTMLRGSLIFGGAVILAAMDLGPWIFKIFLGSQYAAAGALLKYTMWLLILWAWGQFISQVLIARGHFIIFTLCGLTGALILTLTLPLCVSNIDTIGAVISTGLGMAFWALSMLAVLVRLNIAALNVSIFRIVVAVFISLVIYFLFRPISFWLALPISWFALFYGSLWLRGISKEEKSAIVYFWKKFYKIPHSSL